MTRSDQMTRQNMYLGSKQLERLKKISGFTEISVSEHVRRAVDDYILRWVRDQSNQSHLDKTPKKD